MDGSESGFGALRMAGGTMNKALVGNHDGLWWWTRTEVSNLAIRSLLPGG